MASYVGMRAWSRKFLWLIGVAIFIFGLTWLYFSWRWQSDFRLVTAEDVVVYLVALPLGVFLAVMLFAWISVRMGRLRKNTGDAITGPTTAAGNQPEHTESPVDRVFVLAYGIVNQAGSDAGMIIERMRNGDRIVDIDNEFLNSQGDFLLTGRMRDLDVDGHPFREVLIRHAGIRTRMTESQTERAARIYVLLAQIVADITGKTDLAAALASMEASEILAPEVRSANTTIVKPHTLRALKTLPVFLAIGPQQTDYERSLFEIIFGEIWRASAWANVGYRLELIQDEGIETLVAIDRIVSADSSFALFVAVDSWFSEDLLATIEAGTTLYAPRNPGGMIPAEGAAAIVLGNPNICGPRGLSVVAEVFHGHFLTRDKPASNAGKSNARVLNECVQRALECGKSMPDKIGIVACDSEFNGGRNVEVALAMTECTPDLDAFSDRLAINMMVGNLGSASGLSSLVLAAAYTQAEQKSALALSVRHPAQRGAVLISPHLAESYTYGRPNHESH